jgi:hypothetical protein
MNSEQIVAQPDGVKGKGSTLLAFDKKPSVRMLPNLPILVVYHPTNVAVSFRKRGETILFSLHGGSKTSPTVHNCINAHQLRDAFLSVRTPAQALNWIAASGHFRNLYEDEGFTLARLTWDDFQLWQEFIRGLLRQGFGPRVKGWDQRTEHEKQDPDRLFFVTPDHLSPLLKDLSVAESLWILGSPDELSISQGSLFRYREYPHPQPLVAEITVSSALEAMLATVYVDRITDTKFQACGLRDCPEIYEVSSKHERQYCSQACAHKASVRRRRAKAKAAELEAAQKAEKSRSKKGKR